MSESIYAGWAIGSSSPFSPRRPSPCVLLRLVASNYLLHEDDLDGLLAVQAASLQNAPGMTFRRFEEIEAWQTARKVAERIYDMTDRGAFARDYALRDQVRRAVISTMSNIAEGFSRRSEREFSQYLFVAKASAAELQSHFYIALDRGYVAEDEFNRIYDRLDHYSRQVSNLITYLRTGRKQG